VPWPERGAWAAAHLPAGFSGEVIAPTPDEAERLLPPYAAEWAWLRARRVDWVRYDAVFTWELRTSLAAGLLLPRRRGPRPRWIALGPILKGPVLRALPAVRAVLRRADGIACFSRAECDTQARLLRLPRERFTFVPSPWDERDAAGGANPDGDYVLALGRSNRDFRTLFDAVRSSGAEDLPVLVVAGRPSDLRGAGPVPPNVTLRFSAGPAETDALVAGARIVAVPLRPAAFSAGQSVVLRAMAAGKAVVASDACGLRDYVTDGETAVLVPPADPAALRSALLRLWHDRDARHRLGEEGARSVRERWGYAPFAARLAALAGTPAGVKNEDPHDR
jgi:glycosyltransferase involved in cell wall biosynthesis